MTYNQYSNDKSAKVKKICQKIQTSYYKMNKFWRANIQHGNYS